ncbi:MAG: hypothetical protein ACTHK7_01930 [Aureliella sp.]
MAAQQVELREALRSEVESILAFPSGTVVESLAVPRTLREELEDLHIVFFLSDVQSEILARGLDVHEFTIGIAIQQGVRIETSDDTDALVEFVETVKSLWAPDGELREMSLAGFQFKELQHRELYDSKHLLVYKVFTSIVEITYTTEIE